MTKLRELLDTALFPIERPDFFENADEYYDIIIDTVKKWLESKKVTTGADDSPRLYDSWLNNLITELSNVDDKSEV
jgi:hypothetical protein